MVDTLQVPEPPFSASDDSSSIGNGSRGMKPRELSYDVIYDVLMCSDVTENTALLIFVAVLAIIYFAGFWLAYRINEHMPMESESLQHCMILVPLFKLIYFIICLLSLFCCYSESSGGQNFQRYLLMLLVAAETITRTAIACFFYLIAKGWGTMHFDFDPMEATNCARFLACAYLCHSAYIVTSGVDSVHAYLRILVVTFYVWVLYKVVFATVTNLRMLKRNEGHLRDQNMLPQFEEAVRLKRYMLKNNNFLAGLYILFIVMGTCRHFLYTKEAIWEFRHASTGIFCFTVYLKELAEVALVTAMYANVRPRHWPPFFSLEMQTDQLEFIEGMGQLRQQDGLDQLLPSRNQRRIAPVPELCEASMHESSYKCTSKALSNQSEYSLGELSMSSIQTDDDDDIRSEGSYRHRMGPLRQGVPRSHADKTVLIVNPVDRQAAMQIKEGKYQQTLRSKVLQQAVLGKRQN